MVVEGSHEAIIDRETWDIVQRVRQHKRRRTNMDEQNKYSGLVVCADCGSTMVLHRAHTMKPTQNNFTCRTYKRLAQRSVPPTTSGSASWTRSCWRTSGR